MITYLGKMSNVVNGINAYQDRFFLFESLLDDALQFFCIPFNHVLIFLPSEGSICEEDVDSIWKDKAGICKVLPIVETINRPL